MKLLRQNIIALLLLGVFFYAFGVKELHDIVFGEAKNIDYKKAGIAQKINQHSDNCYICDFIFSATILTDLPQLFFKQLDSALLEKIIFFKSSFLSELNFTHFLRGPPIFS